MADRKAILLRIPPDLWEQLNRWARDDLRSVNAQIEFLLRSAVRKRESGRADRADSPPAHEHVQEFGTPSQHGLSEPP